MKFLKKNVKKLNRKEKGFTLVELLVVIAILGILAAVTVPSVNHFIGKGKTESGATELSNVQVAMTAMMADQNISSLTATTAPTNLMDEFPTTGTVQILNGSTYNPGNLTPAPSANYLQKATTKYYYTVDADGTVHGWWTDTATHVQGTTGEIGVETAP